MTAKKPLPGVPNLRFPEFRALRGWPQTKMSTVLKEHGLRSDGTSEVHSVSLTKGIVPQVEHMGRSFAANNTSHYGLVRAFDLVYTRSPLSEYKLGIVKQHKRPTNALVSPLYGVFEPRNRHLGLIVEAYFDSPARNLRYLDPLAQKGAKNTIQLSNDRFLSGTLYLPEEEDEQRKIAECLGSLDDLIALEGRRLVALRQHKQGLMQQLFPRPGEAMPRLRFAKFANRAAWQATTIGGRCESFSGGTPDTSKGAYYGGTIPFIRSAEIGREETELFLTQEGLANSSAKMVKRGDVLVALYGANSGDTALARVDGAINQAIICLRSKDSASFLYHFLTAMKGWIVATYLQGGQGNLSGQILLSVPLKIPEKDEQEAVADCLCALDSLINGQFAKINALKRSRQGLMQKIFPSPEAEY